MAVTAEKPFTSSDMMSEAGHIRSNSDIGGPSEPASTMPSTNTNTRVDAGVGAAPGGDMLGRVVQGAHNTIDRLAETAAPHLQRLQEGVGAQTEHVKEVGEEWAESLRHTVRENPLAAVATALALGMLLSRLTRD